MTESLVQPHRTCYADTVNQGWAMATPIVDVGAATTKALTQAAAAGLSQVGAIVEDVRLTSRRGRGVWVAHIRAGGAVFTAEIEQSTGKVIAWHKGY